MYSRNKPNRRSADRPKRRVFVSGGEHHHAGAHRSGSHNSVSARGGRPQHTGRYGGMRPQRPMRRIPTFDPTRFINTHPAPEKIDAYEPTHTFSTFGLDARLEHTIAALKLVVPTPIQDRVIPEILQGSDVVGLAETGTGKTAAFLVPLIHKAIKEPRRQVLILTPTRELAVQIERELKQLARGLRIWSTLCVGGVGIYPQVQALKKHNNFIIGTPGRILDLMRRGDFAPRTVTTIVLDEADRMLDMGFINDMRTVIGALPPVHQTLFFSATMTSEAERLVSDFMRSPVTVSVKKRDVTASVVQDVVRYDHASKFETLLALLHDAAFSRVIIFGSMKHSVEKLAKQLSHAGVPSESIHGNKSHGQRQRALTRFKQGEVRVLVATDVAARGIHVENVSHVINYDLPSSFEDYVHRIGRTGRADKAGIALTFVLSGEHRNG